MISSITLNNFRSYKKTKINLDNNINVFIGKNGQGKTNLLEAIYYISNIRSHRSNNDKDLINNNSDYARIIVESIVKNNKEVILSVIHKDGKYFSINNNAVSKTSDILGRINTVLFYPTETKIFNDSPSARRNFFDVEIGKVSSQYTSVFQEFNKLLKNRNKILKEEKIDEILLDVITDKFIDKQIIISKKRNYLVNYINKHINSYLKELSSKKLNISMEYKSSVKSLNKEELVKKYSDNLKRDKFSGLCNEGIHRDDYIFYTNDVEITKFLSQGQIRLVLLALKFVIIDFIYDKTKKKPILLLDDVLSELDSIHQLKLIKNIPSYVQTIITSTDNYPVFNREKISKFKIENSQIMAKEDFNGRS